MSEGKRTLREYLVLLKKLEECRDSLATCMESDEATWQHECNQANQIKVSLSVFVSVCLCVCRSVCLLRFSCHSVWNLMKLHGSMNTMKPMRSRYSLSGFLPVCWYVLLSVCQSVRPSISPPTSPSVCPSVCPSIRLFTEIF